MPRGRGRPFQGHISNQVTGLPGWIYNEPRAYGAIYDPIAARKITDSALGIEILSTFGNLNAQGLTPIGPRSVGYILLGMTIGGQLVVKDKDHEETHLRTGSKERKAALAKYIDFDDIIDVVTALRRCGALRFDWVADGRSQSFVPRIAVNAEAVRQAIKRYAEGYQPAILDDQDVYTECWVEAAGLVQLVGRILGAFGIRTYSGSGDVPLDAVKLAANRYAGALKDGKRVVVMILGDYDIHGVGNADRLAQDIEHWMPAAGMIEWRWIGPDEPMLTRFTTELGPSIGGEEFGSGGKWLPRTLQADALVRGGVISTVLDEAVNAVLDMEQVEATRERWDDEDDPLITLHINTPWQDVDDLDDDDDGVGGGTPPTARQVTVHDALMDLQEARDDDDIPGMADAIRRLMDLGWTEEEIDSFLAEDEDEDEDD